MRREFGRKGSDGRRDDNTMIVAPEQPGHHETDKKQSVVKIASKYNSKCNYYWRGKVGVRVLQVLQRPNASSYKVPEQSRINPAASHYNRDHDSSVSPDRGL